jgi:Subtilisin-like serine proteases
MRLTRLAYKRAISRVVTPVIIEVYPGKLAEVYEEIRQYEFRLIPRLIDRVFGEIEFPIFEFRLIPTFNMIAAVLPREIIFDLAEDPRVVRIYSDELVFALQYPTVPPQGVYRFFHPVRRRTIEFTSTFWTKRLMGCDVANAKGFTGEGVKVAVLDTGASVVHEQLRGRIAKSISVYPGAHVDVHGHGTYCAACVGEGWSGTTCCPER